MSDSIPKTPCRIQRVGPSTHRVTRGRSYVMRRVDGYHIIYTDDGSQMRPRWKHGGSWRVLSPIGGCPKKAVDDTDTDMDDDMDTSPVTDTYLTKEKEEIPMSNKLTIENTTLINGSRCDDVSDEGIIKYVEQEQAKITRLQELPVGNSHALWRMRNQHERNVERLLQILDARYDGENRESA